MTFLEKLRASINARESLLFVGLDPELDRLPSSVNRTVEGVLAFNRAIVDATADLACAYKPNLAFYEAMGPNGMQCLIETVRTIPADIPIIGDAKRGDVGNTARQYAKALFETIGCDAVTVNPYLGEDAIEPFVAYANRGVFILCRTSNPGAAEIQDLLVSEGGTTSALYEFVAWRAHRWNRNENCGLVVGATAPKELRRIRELAPDLPLLIPGVGSQGGDLAAAIEAHRPSAPAIINASRSILYASNGSDFAAAARASASRLRETMALSLRA